MVHTNGISGKSFLSYSTSVSGASDTSVKCGNRVVSALRRPQGRRATGKVMLLVLNPTMSMIRPIAWLVAAMATLMVAASANAQSGPIGPGVGTQMSAAAGTEAFWNFQPFIDPGYFQPDFQWFAPAEVSDYGGGEPPNHGIYVTFDRTYVTVTRPINQFSFGSG